MEKPVEGTNEDHNHLNWSERVEDLLASGDSEQAIALLESVVLKLETLAHSETADLLLASALTDLAKLYSSRSFSLKSDELLSRASVLKQRAIRNRHSSAVQNVEEDSIKEDEASSSGVGLDCNNLSVFVDGHRVRSSTSTVDPNYEGTPDDGAAEDDWEAIVDRDPNELVSSQCLPGVSNLTLEETKSQTPKRRGRGTFAYEKHELYSEQPVDYSLLDDVKTENASSLKENNTPLKHSKYGTKHVLVLANFSPTMRTIDLENLFQEFRDHGFAIRWVNDTTALAVFRTPSIALEAFNSVQCPFTVRILDENDILMSSISSRDLEPPCQRPQTSVRTARRLIAHGMGLKLSSASFGSRELKGQEEARKNRITTRQKLRDDAWGDE